MEFTQAGVLKVRVKGQVFCLVLGFTTKPTSPLYQFNSAFGVYLMGKSQYILIKIHLIESGTY